MKKTKYGLLLALASLVLAGCGGTKDPTKPATPSSEPTPSVQPSTPSSEPTPSVQPSTPTVAPTPSTHTPTVNPTPSVQTPSETPSNPALLTEIAVSGAKSNFKIGEAFSDEGLVVKATYSDGSERVVEDYDVDYSDFDNGLVGEYTIVVSYAEGELEESAEYSVNVEHNFTLSTALITGDPYDYVALNEVIQVEGLDFEAINWSIDNERVATIIDGVLYFISEGETQLVATYTVYDEEQNPIDDEQTSVIVVNPKTRWGLLELEAFATYLGTTEVPYVDGVDYYGYDPEEEAAYFLGYGIDSEGLNELRDGLAQFNFEKAIDYGTNLFNESEDDHYVYEAWVRDIQIAEGYYVSLTFECIVFNESGTGLSPTGEGILQIAAYIDYEIYAKSISEEDLTADIEAFESPLLKIDTAVLPELEADRVIDASTSNLVDYAALYYPESNGGMNFNQTLLDVKAALDANLTLLDNDTESYDYEVSMYETEDGSQIVYLLCSEPGYTAEGASYGYIEIMSGAYAERANFLIADYVPVQEGDTADLLEFVQYATNYPFIGSEIEFALVDPEAEGVYLTDWIDEFLFGVPAGTLYALLPGEYEILASDGTEVLSFTVVVLESDLLDYAGMIAKTAFADFDLEVVDGAILDLGEAVAVYTPLQDGFLYAESWTEPEDILENAENAAYYFAYYCDSYLPVNFSADTDHYYYAYDEEANEVAIEAYAFDPELEIMVIVDGTFKIDEELGYAVITIDFFYVTYTTDDIFYYAIAEKGVNSFNVGDEFTTEGLSVASVAFNGEVAPVSEDLVEIRLSDVMDEDIAAEEALTHAGIYFVDVIVDGERIDYYSFDVNATCVPEVLDGALFGLSRIYPEFEYDLTDSDQAYVDNDQAAFFAPYTLVEIDYDIIEYYVLYEAEYYASLYEMTVEEIIEYYGYEALFEEAMYWDIEGIVFDDLGFSYIFPSTWTCETYDYGNLENGYYFVVVAYDENLDYVVQFEIDFINNYDDESEEFLSQEIVFGGMFVYSSDAVYGTASVGPDKTEYYVGEALDLTGAAAYALTYGYLYYGFDPVEIDYSYTLYNQDKEVVEELGEAGEYTLLIQYSNAFGSGYRTDEYKITVSEIPTYPELAGTYVGTFGQAAATIVLGDDTTGSIVVDGGTTITFNWYLDEKGNFVLSNVVDNSGLFDELELRFTEDGKIVGSIVEDFEYTLEIEAELYVAKTIAGTWEGQFGYNKVTLVVYNDGTVLFNGELVETVNFEGNVITFEIAGYAYTFTYNEAEDSVHAHAVNDDEFYDEEADLIRTAEAEDKPEEQNGLAGTYTGKVGYNDWTLVINDDGTVVVNGEAIGDVVFDGSEPVEFELGDYVVTLTYNEADGTISVLMVDQYEGYEFEGTLAK